jgi:hypothetical protein
LELRFNNEGNIKIENNELIGDEKNKLKDKTMGCFKSCPICRRKCDQDHPLGAAAGTIHSCERGHQI